jgi:DNA repair photolyase
MEPTPPIRGRGSASNPPNRFEAIELEPEPDEVGEREPIRTQFLRDATRSIIARNQSPDLGFDASINPYRGCEHGCAYCYARPTHEYLGMSAGLDFETRILVKEDAARLLAGELSAPSWQPRLIALSGVTDAYQPIERRLGLTRACLQVLARFRNPVAIVTKNHLVTRDIDVLQELARVNAAAVCISLTTLDDELCGVLEPRTSRPPARLEAIARLSAAGIPVGVLLAPMIPALNDHEIPALVAAAAQAGAGFARYVVLRLPYGVKELFDEWLARHAPLKREKVLNRVRALRGGRLYDSRFGTRQSGEGVFADEMASLFKLACKKAGLSTHMPELSCASFRPRGERTLFDR